MPDHLLDECDVVRLIVGTDNGVDLSEVREVGDLHVQGKLDPEGIHVLQVGLHRLLQGRVETELSRVPQVPGHQRVRERRLHRTGRPGHQDDLRRTHLGPEDFVETLDGRAQGHETSPQTADATGPCLT